MKRLAILFVSSVILVILFQNMRSVSLNVLWWKLSLPQIVFFPLILGLGLVIGFIWGKRA